VIYFPPAKINLGLKITGKREDGFHEIQSLFLPTNWCDVLEVIVVENGESGKLNLTLSGLKIPEGNSSNTVVRAHELLSEKFNLPEIDAQLLKIIPTGAGLGGGSSNGSFMLKAINELCKLEVSNQELKSLASELGSDCPFFIDNIPSLVSGRGEIITPLPFSSEDLKINKLSILLIHPRVHVNTGVAFTLLNQDLSNKKLQFLKLPSLPLNQWKEVLHNDFQIPLVNKHPEILNAINIIEYSKAEYVQMTGSGSSVFGLYQTENHDIDFIKTAIKKAEKLGFTTYFGAL
jgi:4-diphosphocytidyl-2-C-methyl-D-erythritol kinase|tara:strand:- start:146 stop:1015 length:870 start_codon:yes stop_codon:yes gene_type:complete